MKLALFLEVFNLLIKLSEISTNILQLQINKFYLWGSNLNSLAYRRENNQNICENYNFEKLLLFLSAKKFYFASIELNFAFKGIFNLHSEKHSR